MYVGKYQGRTVAIKQFNNPEKLDDREFRKELAIMSLVREPARVLPCYGGSSKKGNKFIGTFSIMWVFSTPTRESFTPFRFSRRLSFSCLYLFPAPRCSMRDCVVQ